MAANDTVEDSTKPPEDHQALAQIIAYRSMRAASAYLAGFKKFRIRVPAPDIIAFETLAFNAFAIRHAYNPLPRFGAEDFDDVERKHDHRFDNEVNDAFNLAAGTCAVLAERATGWDDLIEITNRRQMHYALAKSDEDMNSRFFDFVRNCQTSTRPQISYATAPVTDDKLNGKLQVMTMGYAYMHVPPQAREIDKVIVEHGFGAY